MSKNKILTACGAIMMMLLLVFLSGCNTQDRIDEAVAEALNAKQAEVDMELNAYQNQISDILENQKSLEAEIAEKDAALEEANEAIEALNAEIEVLVDELVEEEEEEISLAGHIVTAKGNLNVTDFSVVLDNVDYAKLYTGVVRYNRKDYIVDEVLTLTSDIKPAYNIKDKDAEIFVQIANRGAITYEVKISDEIDFKDGEYFGIEFLGKSLFLSNLTDDEAKFYQGIENFVKAGESITIDDIVIKLVTVGDNRALVEVTNNGITQSAVISEDFSRVIAGIDVHVSEIMKGTNDIAYATLTVSLEGDVEYNIRDGDYYEADDDYVWVITKNSIGIRLDVAYDRDDEILALGDSIVLPNNYLKITFDNILYADVEDFEFSISGDRIRLYYNGIIRVDGTRATNVVIDVKNDSNIVMSYDIGSVRYTDENITSIEVYNRDRKLDVTVTNVSISIADANYNYTVAYNNSEFIGLTLNGANVGNKDDDKIIENGDIVYNIDFDNSIRRVIVGLVSDRDLELDLRVE